MAKRKERKKKAAKPGLTRQQAADFINQLDSKHQSLQPILQKLVAGKTVTAGELDTVAETDSRAGAVVQVLRDVNSNGGVSADQVREKIEALDSFGAPLKPLLSALNEGLQAQA